MAQGGPGVIGEYDLSSGCCLATTGVASTPACIAYSPDGELLVSLQRDRSVVAFYGAGLADKTLLLPGSSRGDKGKDFHLAVTAVRAFDHLQSTASVLRPSTGAASRCEQLWDLWREPDVWLLPLLACRAPSRWCSCASTAAAASGCCTPRCRRGPSPAT